MPTPTDRNDRFTALRAAYDTAFAMLCHARRELDARSEDNVMVDEFRRLQAKVEVCEATLTRARNDLAMYLLDRLSRASRGKLFVGSEVSQNLFGAGTGA